jgi:hypothetical protein
MKNVRQDSSDSLRPEYKRSDFGEMVLGKHANTQIALRELVRLLLACIGEDAGLKFIHHSPDSPFPCHRLGDWTYEFDDASQITLRYWLSGSANVEEPISNPPYVANAQERSNLQNLLTEHVHALKSKVIAL